MRAIGTVVLAWSAVAALTMLAVALVLACVRLLRGPTLPDRVVALDLMSILAVGIVAAYSVRSGRAVYLDAAVVVTLISFLGTVAFARYIALRGGK